MMSEKENKFKKEVEEMYKSQRLKEKEIFKPTEKDIRRHDRILLTLKSFGYFFVVFYLIAFFKIEPMFSFLNKTLDIPNGWIIFLVFTSFVCIYHSAVDMFQRVKKFFKKDN